MNKIIRTICSVFTAAGSVTALTLALALALALPLSTAQASSDYIVYQGVAFDDGTAVASKNISLQFTILASNNAVVYQETQADVTTTDKGFFSHQIGSGIRTDGANTYADIVWADDYKLKVEVDYANGASYTDLGTQALSSSVYALRAKTAAKLATPINIGGVSFDGTQSISLPGVNETGVQSTSGNAATATTLTDLTSTVAELNYVDGVTSLIQTQLDGKEPSFTKNTGFNKNFGTATNTVIHGNDTRLSNARTPLSHIHGQISNTGAITSAEVAPASNDYLILSDASGSNVLRRGVLIGTGTTTYLRNNGTWGTPPNTTYSAGTGLSLSGTTFTNTAPHVATNLTVTPGTTAGPRIDSSTGANVVIPTASASASGIVTTGSQIFNGNKTFSGAVTVTGSLQNNNAYGYLNSQGNTGISNATIIYSIIATRSIKAPEFHAVSDKRVKTDIKPIENSLATITQLKPAEYTKIDKVQFGTQKHYGFIAQEVEAILPEAVGKGEGEVPVLKMFDETVFEQGASYTILVKNAEEETQQEYTTGQERPVGEVFVINKKVDDFRTINYDMVFTQAVAAIQEQQVLIEALQNELKEIKEELRATNQSNR